MRDTSSGVWLLSFGLLVFTMVSVPLLMFDDKSYPRYQSLKAELARSEANAEQIQREVEGLKRKVERLKRDPHAIERIARDDLGMVRPGELIFQFQQ